MVVTLANKFSCKNRACLHVHTHALPNKIFDASLLILVCSYVVWRLVGHYDVQLRKFDLRDQTTVSQLVAKLFGPTAKGTAPKSALLEEAERKKIFEKDDKVHCFPFVNKKTPSTNFVNKNRRPLRKMSKRISDASSIGTFMWTTSIPQP
jgi:hypothetical protein